MGDSPVARRGGETTPAAVLLYYLESTICFEYGLEKLSRPDRTPADGYMLALKETVSIVRDVCLVVVATSTTGLIVLSGTRATLNR